LLSLVQNLYAAHKENQARRQGTSVSKAKQAISDYQKALGAPEGLAELMVFYCERAAGFSTGVSHDDAGYFDALVRMFEQSLKITNTLAGNAQRGLLTRLDRIRNSSYEFGYGVGGEMHVNGEIFKYRKIKLSSWGVNGGLGVGR
jgi:hypothetical protein